MRLPESIFYPIVHTGPFRYGYSQFMRWGPKRWLDTFHTGGNWSRLGFLLVLFPSVVFFLFTPIMVLLDVLPNLLLCRVHRQYLVQNYGTLPLGWMHRSYFTRKLDYPAPGYVTFEDIQFSGPFASLIQDGRTRLESGRVFSSDYVTLNINMWFPKHIDTFAAVRSLSISMTTLGKAVKELGPTHKITCSILQYIHFHYQEEIQVKMNLTVHEQLHQLATQNRSDYKVLTSDSSKTQLY